MTTLVGRFNPPADLNDFSDALKQGWSQFISQSFKENIQSLLDEFAKGGINNSTIQFYDPTQMPTPSNAQESTIVWNAFPNVANAIFPNEQAALKGVENAICCTHQGQLLVFRPQDEYCEWFVKRDTNGKIKSVTFTCEGPEYWEFLAENDAQTLLNLYQTYVDSSVQKKDLFLANGKYNRFNKWNIIQGIMHLSHRDNTLGAEINIAAQATILRKHANGQPVTSTNDLICCARYGKPQRFSDPIIGHNINSLARQGCFVTLKNPIGLYMQRLNTIGWTTPDGSDPQLYWHVVRGDASKNMIVRAVYEVPDSANFIVSDIQINGVPIQYGGQIAKSITIGLTGVAFQRNPPLMPNTIPSLDCIGDGDVPGCPGGSQFNNLCEVINAKPQQDQSGEPHITAAITPSEHHPVHKTRSI